MTDKRQKATKVKCKRDDSNKTVNICGIYSSLEKAFEFCWSSLADEHNTLPKSTSRNVKLNKFPFVSLSRRRSSARNVPSGQERGETDVSQANQGSLLTEMTILVSLLRPNHPFSLLLCPYG